MVAKKKTSEQSKNATKAMQIDPITSETADIYVVGYSPIILHRMSDKAKYELLFPAGRKTSAQKKQSLKHDPLQEFRDAAHIIEDDRSPTYLGLPSTAVKNALRCVGVDIGGASKALLGRVAWVENQMVPIWGIPRYFISVVRMKGIDRTPDIRTRPIISPWAAKFTVSYITPLLNLKTIANLVSASGMIQGWGDWRPEKGSGNFGQFRIVSGDDPEWGEIVKNGGRAAQKAAMRSPEAYDNDTRDLFAWFTDEAKARGVEVTTK